MVSLQVSILVGSTLKRTHAVASWLPGFTAPFYALLYVPNDTIVQALEILDAKVDLTSLRWGDGESHLLTVS
jgi:hypothetical protein